MRWNKADWDPAEPVLTPDHFTVPYTRSYTYGAATSLTMTASRSFAIAVFEMLTTL